MQVGVRALDFMGKDQGEFMALEDSSAVTTWGKFAPSQPLFASAGDAGSGQLFAPASSGGGQGPLFLGDDIADDISTSTTLALGGSLSSSIQSNGDRDYIRITLTAGQSYTFSMDGIGLSDAYLELRDASGTLITSNDDGGIVTDSFMMYNATASGTYYIVARAYSTETGSYQLSFNTIPSGNSSPTTFPSNGLPQYSWEQAAIQLSRDGASWASSFGGSAVVTYSFRSTDTGMPADVSGFSRFNAAQIAAAEAALQAWAAVANITFVRVDDGDGYSDNATIRFGNYSSGADAAAAFAYLPSYANTAAISNEGDVWVNVTLAYNANPVIGDYGPHALLHEIGHALGLDHPADYNAGNGNPEYGTDAVYFQDSRMFTVMTYFGSSNTGGNLGAYASLPQLQDIAAIQRLYGANMASRAGDTIYGFNSNTGVPAYSLALSTSIAVFAIWDGGGNDTLDLSGYSTNSTIDLREEGFSSAGPANGSAGIYNISLARGAVIENAIGGSGNDTITGNAANNTLNGGAGADTMSGGLGDDTYIVDNASDVVSESASQGTDTVQSSLSFTLGANVENLTLTGSAANGTGNTLDNVVTGNAQDNWLIGGDGNDTLAGGDGADTLTGGLGVDTIQGGAGNDGITYTMGDGNGSIDGGADTDSLVISDSAGVGSILNASWNGSALTAVAGNTLTNIESVSANMGDNVDWLIYSTSADVTVNLSTTAATGFSSVSNVERVVGGAGNDTLTGDNLDNRLDGSSGSDTLAGLGGVDTLIGGDGADWLSGGLANDSVQGGAGNDSISWTVGDGRDTIDGGADSDTFSAVGSASAELGNATWNGTSLTALIDNGLANIEAINLDLAGGVDWLIYNTSSAVTVDLSTGSASGFASVANIEKVIGGSGADTLTGDGADNRLDGQGGNDILNGGAGTDTVLGGDGNDTIYASAGNDSLQGLNGDDTFIWTSTDGRDTFSGGANNDTVNLTGSAVADVADVNWNGTAITGVLNNALLDIEAVNMDLGAGGAGGDWLRYNTTFAVSVNLGAGTATGFASITGVENIIGGTGADTLTGDAGVNKINGNNGDDVITGGAGNDNLTGGAGSDTFAYAAGAGADTVLDFDAWADGGQDFIDLSALGINAGNFASRVTIIDTGADTVVRIDSDIFITLKNVSGDGDNSISIADFILGA